MTFQPSKTPFSAGEGPVRPLTRRVRIGWASTAGLIGLSVIALVASDVRMALEWSQLRNPSCTSFGGLGLLLLLGVAVPLLAALGASLGLVGRWGPSRLLKLALMVAVLTIGVSGASALVLYAHGQSPTQHCTFTS
jgi:hypothetical protein